MVYCGSHTVAVALPTFCVPDKEKMMKGRERAGRFKILLNLTRIIMRKYAMLLTGRKSIWCRGKSLFIAGASVELYSFGLLYVYERVMCV